MPVPAYKRESGPHAFAEHVATWRDERRARDVPVRLYVPEPGHERLPLVLFSPGTGLSRDDYRYLGRHWASHGYVAIHLTHPGSDPAALRRPDGTLRPIVEILADVRHRHERPQDVSFALDSVAAEPSWRERVDPQRVAVAGHSFGAYTALALVGLRDQQMNQNGLSFADHRVQAVIAMSPASEANLGQHPGSWDRVDRPVFALTGTKDTELGVGTWERRRRCFDRSPARDQFLLIIRDAEHATFCDEIELRIPTKPVPAAHHDYIRMATTAFLDAYVRADAEAQQWLLGGALAELSAGACALEYKNITSGKGSGTFSKPGRPHSERTPGKGS